MHHMSAYGGKQDPLFSKAIMQSPAFQTIWDRNGWMEEVYQNFTRDVGCPSGNLECLRQASVATLRLANRKIQGYATRGGFSLGPASDGSYVRQLAGVEYLEGELVRTVFFETRSLSDGV
jgi:carboxylesterase type B